MGFLRNTDANNQKILLNEEVSVSLSTTSGSFTYNHNLGYIPSARIWYEPVSGHWYPLANITLADHFTNATNFTGYYSLTTTQLVVNLINLSGSATSKNIWVRIYLDD